MVEKPPPAQPQWDFPCSEPAKSEVIPLPDRQPTYPPDQPRDDAPRRAR